MNRRTLIWILAIGCLGFLTSPQALADAHGPAFGLATPTLAEGEWSSDTVFMSLETSQGTALMYREMLGYGITPDVQADVSFPLTHGNTLSQPPRTRVGSMMGTFQDIEGSLFWRFHRVEPAVGERYESTLLFGISDGQNAQRDGITVGQGVNLAAVTGYVSRSIYLWGGGGVQHYFPHNDGRLGDLYYLTAVWGWRPAYFRHPYASSDWRLFIEALGEVAERNQINGRAVSNSGGRKILIGPSVLGLYGAWGIEAGVLFPVVQSLNGNQPREDYRAKLDFTYWFN
ncbi:MAG TPA: hypothetical protein VJS89_00945 [Gammaproteobacteria bacterium]|nr:hypothetical protein [Gammaproteobacteria bacterium]